MSKLVEAEWQRHSTVMGIPLPKLTASKNRKLAITVHREGGATREEQEALAKHMAHNVGTADRFYDKSDQREARHQCLNAIEKSIRVSKTGTTAMALTWYMHLAWTIRSPDNVNISKRYAD